MLGLGKVVLSIFVAAGMAGCATGMKGQGVVRVREGDAHAEAIAPKSGNYVVAVKAAGTKELWPIGRTRFMVKKGESMGFFKGSGDRLVAFAGDRKVELKGYPMIASYVCWHRLGDDSEGSTPSHHRSNGFWSGVSRGLQSAFESMGDGGLEGLAEGYADSPDRDPDRKHKSQTREHKGN